MIIKMSQIFFCVVDAINTYSQACIKRSTFGTKERWPLKRGLIHLKFSMPGEEKGDLLIQVSA